jgi:hypothetical protein
MSDVCSNVFGSCICVIYITVVISSKLQVLYTAIKAHFPASDIRDVFRVNTWRLSVIAVWSVKLLSMVLCMD